MRSRIGLGGCCVWVGGFCLIYFQFYYVSNVIYGFVIRLNLLLNMFMKSK